MFYFYVILDVIRDIILKLEKFKIQIFITGKINIFN